MLPLIQIPIYLGIGLVVAVTIIRRDPDWDLNDPWEQRIEAGMVLLLWPLGLVFLAALFLGRIVIKFAGEKDK